MVLYKQSSSLSTDTAVALSGTGNSSPELAVSDTNYSAWTWEVMLASVLNIGIADRSEVTGMPWLTIRHGGQPVPGWHLIWTAGWSTKPTSGATSIEIYLNPALYTAGGPWDRFVNAPQAALAGVPSQNYAGLPLVPRTA